MAKRKNYPKPLYIHSETIRLFRERFFYDLRINFFSNKNVYFSKNCISQSLPYDIGKLSGTYAHDSWQDEKNNFDVFIASDLDYDNALNGIFSDDFIFFKERINKRQSIKDDEREKITANVYLIKESDFKEFYKDRTLFIQQKKIDNFSEKELFFTAQKNIFSDLGL